MKFLRYYAPNMDELYMWDGYDLEHASVMEAIGDEPTPENYHGVGTISDPDMAIEVSQRYIDASVRGKQSLWPLPKKLVKLL